MGKFAANSGNPYNFYQIRRLRQEKKFSLIALVIQHQVLSATDDLIHMLTNYVAGIEQDAKNEFENYKLNKFDQSEFLIVKFKDILSDYKKKKSTKILKSLPASELNNLIKLCNEHGAYSKHKHLYFLHKNYIKHSKLILQCINMLEIDCESPALNIVIMLQYLKKINTANNEQYISLKDKEFKPNWMPNKWRTFCKTKGNKFDKSKFEIFVVLSLIQGVKDREIFVFHSRQHTDYNKDLITLPEFRKKIKNYSEIVSLPAKPDDFVAHIKNELQKNFILTNQLLDVEENASIKNNKLILRKIQATNKPQYYKELDALLDEKMIPINLIDIVAYITKKLGLHEYFSHVSGNSVRMEEHLKQVVATIFCYGCNLSAREGERSIIDVNRKKIGRINSEHISESSLNKCIDRVVEFYGKFELPKIWGDGKHASVDGTKWNVYSKNLMAEYHIRYRGYGGIAYYHVSNNYIALFSNFITCGVYEGRYLLDGIEALTDNKPEYIHGDTHSQSFIIFALAYLLGIKVMPRIRHLQSLNLYKSSKADKFELLDSLFKSNAVHWNDILDNTDEMFRVAISIREGKIKPSEFLNKLAYCGGRNKLYVAFRELGRALRTTYILKYIANFDLRKEVHAATCNSEEFNEYVNWISFADDTIRSNHRVEQKKFIKYNHLVTDMTLLYTVEKMSKVIKIAPSNGIEISKALLKYFSPYRKEHIIRLGKYEIDVGDKDNDDQEDWDFGID